MRRPARPLRAVFSRVFAATRGRSGRASRRAPHDTPGEYARIALRRPRAPVYCSRASGAGTPRGTLREEARRTPAWCRKDPPAVRRDVSSVGPRSSLSVVGLIIHRSPHHQDHDRSEWTRSRSGAPRSESSRSRSRPPTTRRGCGTPRLVDVDDQRFRIAVPNGFAKDWLETRYRSLISQTLARVVGYSVQVEFVVAPTARPRRGRRGAAREPRPARPRRAHPGRRPRGCGGRRDQPQPALHLLELHRRVGQPARARGIAVGRRAPGPRLQPAVPVRRRGPRQDPPDARDRQRGRRQVPAQARRLRDQREVHQRVHHLDPAGQDRRVPRPLPPDRPAPHRRHPVHRRQGADPGGVLPHLQRDPRGRQADRAVLRPAAEGDPDAGGAAALALRVGPHRGPHRAGPRDADRDPARQGRGAGRRRSPRT